MPGTVIFFAKRETLISTEQMNVRDVLADKIAKDSRESICLFD